MTNLNKVVRRRTHRPYDHHGRRIVVQLEPGDILAMREERRKEWFRIAIPTLFTYIVRMDAESRIRSFERRRKELIKSGWPKREARSQARKEAGL